MLERFGKSSSDVMYFLFRIIIGVIFLLHGVQKIGWLDKEAATGFMLFIGWSELLIGLGIALGVLSRLAASGGIIIMIGALATVHWPKSLIPLTGESAWLYLAAFLLILAWGNGKLSLERAARKKELI